MTGSKNIAMIEHPFTSDTTPKAQHLKFIWEHRDRFNIFPVVKWKILNKVRCVEHVPESVVCV